MKICVREPKRFWRRGRRNSKGSKGCGKEQHRPAMAGKLQTGKINGALSAVGVRFGIIVSRFNSFITGRLLAAAVDALERAGATSKDAYVGHVPGAFELPLAAKKLAATGKEAAPNATRCVDCCETTHHEFRL